MVFFAYLGAIIKAFVAASIIPMVITISWYQCFTSDFITLPATPSMACFLFALVSILIATCYTVGVMY
jgi:hypothetical protein